MAQYLLVFHDPPDQDPLLVHVLKIIKSAGFVVYETYATGGLVVVEASEEVLEKEAAQAEIHKFNTVTGRQELFDPSWRDAYANIDTDKFLEPFEKSYLTHRILYSLDDDAEFWTIYDQSKHKAAKKARPTDGSRTHLIPLLFRLKLLEHITPTHDDRAAVALWKGQVGRLFQDPNAVRGYFGEAVAYYFAWMNYQTLWTAVPAVIGGLFALEQRTAGWTVDDNPYLPFYSAFMVVWAVLGIKLWRRTARTYAWKWDVIDVDRTEILWPDFHGSMRKSPVTGRSELYFSPARRIPRYILSIVVTCVCMFGALALICLSLNFQGYIDDPSHPIYVAAVSNLALEGAMFDKNSAFMSLVPVITHVVVIQFVNGIYQGIARKLTAFENHRTEQDHTNSLIVKRYIFEAFDCFVPLFYLAFVAQDVNKVRKELVALFTADCARRLATETLLPYLTYKFVVRKKKKAVVDKVKAASGEKPVALQALEDSVKQEYEEFDDFLEMVIQFGYITMFASAAPAAPVVALLYNIIESKSDIFKLTHGYQRPHVLRVRNNGSWESVLTVQAWLSLFTNVMIFGFSSEQLLQWIPDSFDHVPDADTGVIYHTLRPEYAGYGVALLFVLEHLLMAVMLGITFLISDEPEAVYDARRRREYEVEQQLLTIRRDTSKKMNGTAAAAATGPEHSQS